MQEPADLTSDLPCLDETIYFDYTLSINHLIQTIPSDSQFYPLKNEPINPLNSLFHGLPPPDQDCDHQFDQGALKIATIKSCH